MTKPTETVTSGILTVEDVAVYLKITQRSVYGLLAKNVLPAFKVGGSWRFKREALDDWIARNTLGGKSHPSPHLSPQVGRAIRSRS